MPRMIIVDDEETIRLGLKQIVGRLLPEWDVAASCEDAASAITEIVKNPIDLAIIDINMPGMDGLELARELEAIKPDLFKIILTGHEKFTFVQTAMRYGVCDYLLKPVQREDLVQAVRKVEMLMVERDMHSIVLLEKLLLEWFISNSNNRFEELQTMFRERVGLSDTQEYGVLVLFWEQEQSSMYRMNIDLVASHIKRLTLRIKDVIGVTLAETCTLFVVSGTNLPSSKEWRAYFNKLGLNRRISYGQTPRINSMGCSEPFTQFEELRSAYFNAVDQIFRQHEHTESEPGEDWSKELIVAIEMNDHEATIRILQRWKQEMQHMSEKDPARTTMYCLQFLAFLSSPSLLDIQSKLAIQLDKEGKAFMQQLPITLTPPTILQSIESFIDGLLLADVNEPNNYRKVIVKAQQIVKEEFGNPELNLDMIAQRVFLHPTYLSELFKQTTGQKFIDYITDLRMEEARRILRETDAKMYEIASAVGYTSAKYFSTLFRKRYQITPMMYRERAQ